jgi:hypothetical protein
MKLDVASVPVVLSSTVILTSHLCLGLASGLFPLDFSDQNFVCISEVFRAFYMCRQFHPPLLDRPNTWRRLQTLASLITQMSPGALHGPNPLKCTHTRVWVLQYFSSYGSVFISRRAGRQSSSSRPRTAHGHADIRRPQVTSGDPPPTKHFIVTLVP